MNKKLIAAISEMRKEEALRFANESLAGGEDPSSILSDCQEAMNIVGSYYEKGDYYLPELIFAGDILKNISDIVKPNMAGRNVAKGRSSHAGKVVLGTVHGDIHDIGKDIVAFMLEVNGFEVHDLGIDVPEEKFVEAVKEIKPQVVGLSGLLTLAFNAMKSTIEALEKAGLRKNVKIMIGGGQVDETVSHYVNADGYGRDAMTAVHLAKQWIPKK